MPNVLAHYGVQGVVTRAVVREAEPRWILLGCLVPDIPWILQRLAGTLLPGLDPYDLRLYVIVQASFAICLLLCGALALLSSKPAKVFCVLVLNTFLHLLLDACQTKWANGVHLFAPFSWKLLNFGLFWPESLPTILLTIFGLGYVSWTWWYTVEQPTPRRHRSFQRLFIAVVLLLTYIFLPMALRFAPYAQDNHSVQTLREHQLRAGRTVAFDRNLYINRSAGDVLRTFAGEELHVTGQRLGHSGLVSVRATFVDPTTIRIGQLHTHGGRVRDFASYLGLCFLAVFWTKRYWQRLRARITL
jgi:membrane-bound metal-dependent hydrolase YbcI (DUF457 family)